MNKFLLGYLTMSVLIWVYVSPNFTNIMALICAAILSFQEITKKK